MFENDHDDVEAAWNRQRRGYLLCRAGFALLAANLLVSGVLNAVSLAPLFTGQFVHLGRALGVENLYFYTDTFRCWTRVMAGVLLTAAWSQSGWRRRAGVYLAIASVEALIWSVQYAQTLGLADQPPGHDMLRVLVLQFLSLSRLFLMANLAADFCSHLGFKPGVDLAKTARGSSSIACVFWVLFMLQGIEWRRWPLAARPMDFHLFQLERFFAIFLMISVVQLFLLTLMSSRSASHALRDMKIQEADSDPWSAAASDPGRNKTS